MLPNAQSQMGGGLGGGLGGGGIGGMNGGLNALGKTDIKGADPLVPSNTRVPIPIFSPLAPNAFQQYLLQVTGQSLPLFGADFFENIRQFETSGKGPDGISLLNSDVTQGAIQAYYPFATLVNAPVISDYVLGPGDQLLIRAWGSIDINYQAVLDRNGQVSIPKVGTILMSGVKFSGAEGVIQQAFARIYKNFELNVTMGQTRSITVYVVGQARRPGSYTLSGLSTLSSALFASGGPNNNGSMRRVQLKRANQIVATFDLYQFLSQGMTIGDVRLIDGDVLVIPPSLGYIGLIGKLNTQAVFELKSETETLDDLLKVSGGLAITTNPLTATLERLDTGLKQPRSVVSLNLNDIGLSTPLKKGDVISFYSITTDLANAVTLRGNVSQPMRMPWSKGLSVHDLIPSREILMTKESVRQQNEVLFDANQIERTQREREKIPLDLLLDPTQQPLQRNLVKSNNPTPSSLVDGSLNKLNPNSALALSNQQNPADQTESSVVSLERWQQQLDRLSLR